MAEVLSLIFTGLCNGLGTATGSYLATRYAIKHIERLDKKFNGKKGDDS